MSILLSTEEGWIISHLKYLNDIYKNVKDEEKIFFMKFNEDIFFINTQYLRNNQFDSEQGGRKPERKSRKRNRSGKLSDEILQQMNYVKESLLKIKSSLIAKNLFKSSNICDNNEAARKASDNFYSRSSVNESNNFHGSNQFDTPIITKIGKEKYLFPEKCNFYCYDVRDIGEKLRDDKFHFILMDPPWWNKFVRRRNDKNTEKSFSYKMMYNEELAKISIDKLLTVDGIVAVWCTNAPSHIDSIINEMFLSWGVEYVARWYWVKVTQSGKPVCDFNETLGKQPYESLIIGKKSLKNDIKIPEKKLIVSVPSGIHSHKPPIAEIMKAFLPKNPRCLEIFARYLLPGWTSFGLEVLKFQHLSLYTQREIISNDTEK